jgi:hypothetical protein
MNIESATSKNAESKQESVLGHLAEAKRVESKQESVADHLAEAKPGVAEHHVDSNIEEVRLRNKVSEDDGRNSEGEVAKALISRRRGRKERRVWKESKEVESGMKKDTEELGESEKDTQNTGSEGYFEECKTQNTRSDGYSEEPSLNRPISSGVPRPPV